MQIQDYSIIEILTETRKSIVYRAQKAGNAPSVIIKVLNIQYPTPSDMARFNQEFEIIKNFDMEGIVKVHEIIRQDHQVALVIEDFDGISLKQYMHEIKISIPDFLVIAVKLADILGYIHKNNVIHKDIKPNNIIIHPVKKIVKITDFGISQELTYANEDVYSPDIIEGTLPYMSPEQTGRMNRTVDYRTDLYSLGITFYEMLAGKLPFVSKKPMEIIHSHIARQPRPLTELDESIPAVISDIVMKLMAKTADERYQNSYGLLADLQECLQQFRNKGRIEPFPLGLKDMSLRFNTLQVLLGREKEIDLLIKAFERVSSGKSELILVTGKPGIGKSAVVNEIRKSIVARGGYFISGKYGQFKKDVPYSAFFEAIQEFIRQILAERQETIESWKKKWLEALGPNGKLITDIMPDIALIIGRQPEVPALDPQESKNRFNLVILNFLSVFMDAAHPLVLFLDNLQWADSDSLLLIRNIMTDKAMRYLLFAGAYREHEVDSSHLLTRTLNEIKENQITINRMLLSPLEKENVNQFIARFLRCTEEKSSELAKSVYKKTGGNPFFIIQFLKTLYDKHLLELDPAAGWSWEIEKINTLQVTENVVDLLAGNITKLAPGAREILKTGACIGSCFDPELLAAVMEKSPDKILPELTPLIEEGFIYRDKGLYRFQHDRILETAYGLLSDSEKTGFHYKIGNLLLKMTKSEEHDNKISEIVNQLNPGSSLIDNQKEKDNLAKLNLKAGRRAKAATAYKSALHYFQTGIGLLGTDCWQEQYELTALLHMEAVEAAYLSADYAEMERLSAIVLKYARSVQEKVKIYVNKILSLSVQNKEKEALDFGISVLKTVNIRFPANPSFLHIFPAFLKAKSSLAGRKIEDLLDLPEAKDPYLIAQTTLISYLIPPALHVGSPFSILMPLKQINLAVKHGSTVFTPFIYAFYGWILSGMGEMDAACRFGELALKLAEKLGLKEVKAAYMTHAFIRFWKEHIRESAQSLIHVYRTALDLGDLESAIYCLFIYILALNSSGKELGFIVTEIEKYYGAVANYKQSFINDAIKIVHQHVLNLMGKSENPCCLKGTVFNEKQMLPVYKAEKSGNTFTLLFFINYFKMVSAYLLHEDKLAFETAHYVIYKRMAGSAAQGNQTISLYYFHSLILVRAYPGSTGKNRKLILHQITRNQKILKKWSQHAPMNILHKYYLVEAELARILNKTARAMEFYEKAINSAHENEFTNEEAIANEAAGRFYLEHGLKNIAGMYIQQAYAGFRQWEAAAKLRDMEKRYPGFLPGHTKNPAGTEDEINKSLSSSSRIFSSTLDLSTVIKMSQAISSEITLNKLLNRIIAFLLENAGAQRGFLILKDEKDGRLYIEAEGEVDKDIAVLRSVTIEETDRLSPVIVNYVAKTNGNVILHDAFRSGPFTSDPYIMKNRVKSILCSPITFKGKTSGILYLENRLATDVFTAERIELLSILSSQAAISIENARLLVQREQITRFETEMQIAQNIQTALVPRKPQMAGYEIAAYMKSTTEMGGDYYDVIHIGSRDWIIIGDVCGHGVSAGLVMIMVQSCIHTLLNTCPDLLPSELLTIINNTIIANNKKLGTEHKYMTMTVFITSGEGKFVFSGAHQDILIYRKNRQEVEAITTTGIWIGLVDDVSNILTNNEFSLETGDTMLIYTDGITEARCRTDNKDLFGMERLMKLLASSGNRTVEDIKAGIIKALLDYNSDDDAAILVLQKM